MRSYQSLCPGPGYAFGMVITVHHGSDNGAGLGLPIHMLQPHSLGSVVIQNLPFGFLPLHSAPLWPNMQRMFVRYFI